MTELADALVRERFSLTMLATVKIEVVLVVLVVLNLIGMTIAAWHIMRRK